MKFISQFGVILALSFLGEVPHRWIPLPVPASIYGIVLLFLGLHFRWISAARIRDAARFLIEILPLLFLPAAVGLMDSWETVRVDWAAYAVIIAVSTFLVFGVSGVVTERLMRRDKEGGEDA